MDSWWDLGEWTGYYGEELDTHKITCPFCNEKGNFSIAFHAEKKKQNDSKKLNFDTLQCGNCSSYVQAFWSAGSDHHHDFRVVPWPLRIEKYPDHWPDNVGRYWLQAKRNIKDKNWDAAALMARSALQVALRERKAKGNNLKQEIDDLSKKGLLPPIMQEWAHNVRELGNDSAHPKPDQPETEPKDAKDIVYFMDYLFEYLYTLPEKIKQYRDRNSS